MLDKGWDGIKTGITDAAGPCLASSVRMRDEQKKGYRYFIIILLCSKTMDTRWEECQKIADWAIRHTTSN